MIFQLLEQAKRAGARLVEAVKVLGLSVRTIKRWRKEGVGEDRREGPRSAPANAFSEAEVALALTTLSAACYRDLAPDVVAAKLADKGDYIGSSSTMYRILRRFGLNKHRGRARARKVRKPPHLVATKPNQVWSWDITYLPTQVRGRYLYLYVIEDVFSRKVVGYCVSERESAEVARALFARVLGENAGVAPTLTVHSDNGGPMKHADFSTFLESHGVARSYSRPSVSDDNPFSESLFRTVKYSPSWPGSFASLSAAEAWVANWVAWYNDEHLHSGIGYVTPSSRHTGADLELLAKRRLVSERARRANPSRWSGKSRSWKRPGAVRLGRPDHPAEGGIRADRGAAGPGSRVPEAAAERPCP